MKIKRRAREIALKTLFAIEVGKNPLADALLFFKFEDPIVLEYALRLVRGTMQKKDEIDKEIISLLENWDLDRVNEVDKQILRLAIYEISDVEDIDDGLVVFEMVELAKKYGNLDSQNFINGILRNFLRIKENERKA